MDLLTTEKAIHFIKRTFEDSLSEALNLQRVSAPLFVDKNSGLQDNLNGIEKAVGFQIREIGSAHYEIVHSLAKWKRLALDFYGVPAGQGIYTDMNALRPDEDNLRTAIHSVYVDQWDWEKVLEEEQRTPETLKETVNCIYQVLKNTANTVRSSFGVGPVLPEEITFIHSEDLLQRYPELDRKERENAICKEHKAVFLQGIGGELSDGSIHDGRAPDYDDWTSPGPQGRKGLNGDILVWNPVLKRAFELSSMGIRVDKKALLRQLEIRGCLERQHFNWHKKLIHGDMPFSVGGGIGQSRLCMFLLGKKHIGEVQASVWPQDVLIDCEARGIRLL